MAMRLRFVHVRIRSTAMADILHEFGHIQLPVTSLFMVRNIKFGTHFLSWDEQNMFRTNLSGSGEIF